MLSGSTASLGGQHSSEPSYIPVWVHQAAHRHATSPVPADLHLQQLENQPSSCNCDHNRPQLWQWPAALWSHCRAGTTVGVFFRSTHQRWADWVSQQRKCEHSFFFSRWSCAWMSSEVLQPAMLIYTRPLLMPITPRFATWSCILKYLSNSLFYLLECVYSFGCPFLTVGSVNNKAVCLCPM